MLRALDATGQLLCEAATLRELLDAIPDLPYVKVEDERGDLVGELVDPDGGVPN